MKSSLSYTVIAESGIWMSVTQSEKGPKGACVWATNYHRVKVIHAHVKADFVVAMEPVWHTLPTKQAHVESKFKCLRPLAGITLAIAALRVSRPWTRLLSPRSSAGAAGVTPRVVLTIQRWISVIWLAAAAHTPDAIKLAVLLMRQWKQMHADVISLTFAAKQNFIWTKWD